MKMPPSPHCATSGEWSGSEHVLVNGVRLFVDVANPGLIPDCHGMRQKPTVLMLHGGPGFDHVPFKDAGGDDASACLRVCGCRRPNEVTLGVAVAYTPNHRARNSS